VKTKDKNANDQSEGSIIRFKYQIINVKS